MEQQAIRQQYPGQELPVRDQSTAIRRRVLIVAPPGYQHEIAGADVSSLAARLAREGHAVSIRTCRPILRPSKNRQPIAAVSRYWPDQFNYARDLYQAITRHDVIHLMAIPPLALTESLAPALLLAKFLGKQIVVSFAGGSVEDLTGRFARFLIPALRAAHRVTVPTEWSARILARHHLPVVVTPAAIDMGNLTPRLIQDVQPRLLSFIMAGPDSNITTILRAYLLAKQKYPRVELSLVGRSDRLQVAAPVAQRDSSITLVDSSQTETIRNCWSSCDVLVNNSTDDDLPIPVLQAMALGMPVLSCDSGGMTAVIHNNISGLLFPANDPVALAGRIIDLIEQPALVTQLSRSGPTEALRFSWSAVRSRWISLFNR